MKLLNTNNPVEFENYANECLNGHEGIVIHVTEKPCVWTGQLNTFSKEECEKRNLEIFTGKYLGGTIINMKGDVSICLTTWGNSDFAPNLITAFAEYLKQKNINIALDENDVLAENKKVLSWARATTLQGWCQSVMHFSVGKINMKMIKDVCTKPMVKKPGSLKELGIETQEVLDFVNNFIEENL